MIFPPKFRSDHDHKTEHQWLSAIAHKGLAQLTTAQGSYTTTQ